jgi:hypothetical protein
MPLASPSLGNDPEDRKRCIVDATRGTYIRHMGKELLIIGTMRNILLRATYYALVTPLGLAFRLIHDPLARSWRPKQASYWKTPR